MQILNTWWVDTKLVPLNKYKKSFPRLPTLVSLLLFDATSFMFGKPKILMKGQ